MKYLLLLSICFYSLMPVALPQNIEDTDFREKNPWTAAGFSLIVPGTGQMYVKERIWPEALVSLGLSAGLLSWFWIQQQRTASLKPKSDNSKVYEADAHWDALLLVFQIAIPALWLWNVGDAFKQAELSQLTPEEELGNSTNAYIIEENLFSVTLWQF